MRGLACIALGVLLLPVTSAAQTSTSSSFTVGADVVSGCAMTGTAQTSGLDFGTLDFGTLSAVYAGQVSGSVAASGGSLVHLQCTPGISVQLSIDGGQHLSGANRRLVRDGGASNVTYALYTSAAHSTAIPVSTNVAVVVPQSGVLDLPIFGVASLPGGGLMPGSYSDVLQVTLAW